MGLLSFKTQYREYEHLAMRWAFAVIIFLRFHNFWVFSSQPYPVGLAQWVDFTFLNDPVIQSILKVLFVVALLAYGSGRFLFVGLAYLLFYTVSLVTLECSQGFVSHNKQIISLVILAQLTAQIYGKTAAKLKNKPSFTLDDLSIYFTQQMIAAIYIVAGLTKLIQSGFQYWFFPAWIVNAKFISVSIAVANDQGYYNQLYYPIMERGNQIAQFMIDHQLLAQCMCAAVLLLELFSFLLLANRYFSIIMGLSLIVMHLAIGMIMPLNFMYNVYILLIFTVHLPWLCHLGYSKLHQQFS